MFVTNNLTSLHLWLNENLVKHQKVSKYYDYDCLQNLFFLFMSLLIVPIVKSSHNLAEIYFNFLKKKVLKVFNAKVGPQ